MSELLNARNNSREFRWRLLTTASALALLGAVYGTNESEAADQEADRPTVWIELGGQLERMSGSEEGLSPPFMSSITQSNLLSTLDVQRPSAFAIGEEGKVSFEPEGSDWVFSASLRYGRSTASRHRHQQTGNARIPVHFTTGSGNVVSQSVYPNIYLKMADGQFAASETHVVLDFQAGKDVGLGLFGGSGTSVLSAGIRIAQFTSKSDVTLRARPDVHYPTAPITSLGQEFALFKYRRTFHNYSAIAQNQRSFSGIGPSLAWSASVPFAGNSEGGELTFDWGANAAILFGRQKASGHHKTTTRFYSNRWFGYHPQYGSYPVQHSAAKPFNRTRSVTVPNLGGFAGLSFRYSDAKVSFGYRADFFFGAMDGGIDARQAEDRGFFGPFATIGIGLGR